MYPPAEHPLGDGCAAMHRSALTGNERASYLPAVPPRHRRTLALAIVAGLSLGARRDGAAACRSTIGTYGRGLRQLTHLPFDGGRSYGCRGSAWPIGFPSSPGTACAITWGTVFLDTVTGAILFQSSCDPVGGAPFGEQVFAIEPDGAGLRQLTTARGMVTDPDGTLRVELYGPIAYPSRPSG